MSSTFVGTTLSPIEGYSVEDNNYYAENESGYAGYLKNVHMWTEALLEEARYERNKDLEYPQLPKYMDYFFGNQWPSGRPSYKSRATLNRVQRLMWELVSLLTDVRPIAQVISNNKDWDKQATMVDKAIRSWWTQTNADLALAQGVLYGIFGTGYGRLTWEWDLNGGLGDNKLLPLGQDSVMVFKAHASDINTAQAVIYETPMPLGWFRQKYPTRGNLVKPDNKLSSYVGSQGRAPVATGMQFDIMGPAMKRMLGGEKNQKQLTSTYPMAWYRELYFQDWSFNESNATVIMGDRSKNWCYKVPPGKRLYPRLRLIVKGGDMVLYDGPSPYWHGRYPFEPIRLNPVPWNWGGISDFRPLIPAQDIINMIAAGILEMIQKALNPLFYAPKNALSDSVWQQFDPSMPGARIAYSQNSPQPPGFAAQPNVPAYVLNFLGIVMKEMDSNSVGASVSDAANKNQVPSGDTLEALRQSKTTSVRLKGRNLEVFCRNTGGLLLSNILQFYSLKRRIYMFGEKGIVPEDYDLDPATVVPAGASPQDHVQNFIFNIQQGTLLNLDRIEKAVMLARLRQGGDLDRKHLYEGLDLKWDVNDVEKELKRERAENVAALPPAKPGKQSTKSARSV